MPLETDKAGGFKLALSEEIRTGIYRDLFARSIPLWAAGENVLFSDYGIRKVPGWAKLATMAPTLGGGEMGGGGLPIGGSEVIRGIHQNIEGSAQVAYVGDLSRLYRYDGTLAEVGSGYGLARDAGGSVWDSGTTDWDSGTTIFDSGVVRAGHWSIINYGNFVLATNGVDAPQIKKNPLGGLFVSMFGAVTGIFVNAPGAGYVVGDTLTITGGDGSGATAEVISVAGSGEITGVAMTAGGAGYTTVPTGASGGTGSGATFTFSVGGIDVNTVEIFLARGPHVLGFNTSNSGREFIFSDVDDVDTWVSVPGNLAGALEIRELKSDIRAAVPLGPRIAVYGDDQMFLVNYLANDTVFGYQPALNGIGAVSKHAVVAVGPRNFGLSQQGFFMTDGASYQYIDTPIRKWFQSLGQGQFSKAFGYHDEATDCVRWFFPTESSDITEGVAYNYKLQQWSFLRTNKTAGQERVVFSHALTGNSSGDLFLDGQGENDDVSAIVSFARTKPIDLSDADRVKELDTIRFGFTGMGLRYRVGWSETENGSITWRAYRDLDLGFDFDNVRTAGRWLHIEIQSNTLNANWEVTAMEFIGRIEGTR